MQENKRATNSALGDASFDFAKYINLIKRKKWVILAIFSVVFVLWMLVAYKLGPRPVYETTALLQFEQRDVLTMGERGRPENESKVGLLMSRNFLSKVVSELALEVKFSLPIRASIVDSVYLSDEYLQGKYVVKRNNDNLQLFYTAPDGAVQDSKVLDIPYPRNNTLEYRGVGMVINEQFWDTRDEFAFSVTSNAKAVEALRNMLSSGFKNRGRTLLAISIKGEDRYFAAQILNTVIDEFVRMNLDYKKFHTREILGVLTEQLKTAKDDLDEAVEALKEFREKNPWVGLTPDATGIVSGVSTREAEKSNLESRKQELKMLLTRFSSSSGEDRYPVLNEILSYLNSQGSPTVPALISEFTTLNAERNRLESSYGPSHKFVIENSRKMDELERKVLLTANNMIKQFDSRLAAIQTEINQDTYKIRNLPAKELQLAELQRKKSVADQIYSALLVRHNQAKIADAVEVGDILILDPAVVPPAQGKMFTYLKYAVIGLVLGLGAGLGVVFVGNMLDKTVRTSDELEKIIPIRVLAKIPVIKTEKEIHVDDFNEPARIDSKLVTADYSPTPVGEAYRSLRTQLLYNDSKAKSIFITSLNPGEGKSLNAGNLAITFAQQKLPTLLVDGDLRRGVLHNSFACKKKPGLSDFLYSNADITDENIRKIIQQTHIPNLFLLSAGMPIPNPSEILGSQRGADVFEFLKKRFGVLIVDTPPIMVTSDSIILSQYVDKGLFVVRAGKSNVDQIKEKITEYKSFSGKLIGIVLNFAKFDLKKDHYRYSYYNY